MYSNVTASSEMIRHLVISGGAIYGFTLYGCIRHLIQEGWLDMKHIQSIHCTSVGAVIATIIVLKHEFQIVDNYLIKRPWHDVFQVTLEKLISSYQTRGIFGKDFIFYILEPLFRANDLDISTITLHEFYQYSKTDIHIFTVKLPEFELVDLNHLDHPNWLLLDAIYASACIPPLFQPLCHDESWYVDGGFLMNYPMLPCLKRYPTNSNGTGSDDCTPIVDVLGVNVTEVENETKTLLDTKMNLFEYIFLLICLVIKHLRLFTIKGFETTGITLNRVQEVPIHPSLGITFDVFKLIHSMDERKRFIEYGAECAAAFILQQQPSHEKEYMKHD